MYAKDREREEARQAKQERDELQAESKDTVKKWSNTIAVRETDCDLHFFGYFVAYLSSYREKTINALSGLA